MPTGRKYSKKTGRWEKVATEQAFDYESDNIDGAMLLLAFFREFRDYFLDCCLAEDADFDIAFPQRVILRAGQMTESMETTSRGFGKTYVKMLDLMTDGVLYPGTVARYYGPSLNQVAELARTSFHQIEKNYPALANIWRIKSETDDKFWIVTDYGSEIKIGAIQGGNCHTIVSEEIGQETEPKFDFTDYESKVLPTCRQARVSEAQTTPKFGYVTNAARRQNPAFYKYREDIYRNMAKKPYGKSFCMDVSWEIMVLFGIKPIEYVEGLKSKMTREDFLRQFCAYYTGNAENPMISDEDLTNSRRLKVMESRHCGDPNAIYIIGHDVSYELGTKNAKCADVVVKLTEFDEDERERKRDKYKKEVVYIDNYAPPKDYSGQKDKIKELWNRFTLDGGNATYIAIDSWQYGKGVLEELVKPSSDGVNLRCWKHLECQKLEQPDALEVIYPVKAAGAGTRDPDFEIFKYARVEFEQGNVSLLTSEVADGLEQYKRRHRIKTDERDVYILQPYHKTNELCEQIQNLRVVPSGKTQKEDRISQSIQRDSWSALKYALWFASILERENTNRKYRHRSNCEQEVEEFFDSPPQSNPVRVNDMRSRLLQLRRFR